MSPGRQQQKNRRQTAYKASAIALWFVLVGISVSLTVVGIVLTLDLISVRLLLLDLDALRAFRATSYMHAMLRHEGAQKIEALAGILGVVLLMASWAWLRHGGSASRTSLLQRLKHRVGKRELGRRMVGSACVFAVLALCASVPLLAAMPGTPGPDHRQRAALAATAPRSAPGEAISPGALYLSATFNSIGIEVPFSGDDDATTTADLDFRPESAQVWRPGLPLWRTDDGVSRTFFGSALLLDPDTTYHIRVTLRDSVRFDSSTVLEGSIRTRAETITPAADLTPTHFVRADGADDRDGTTPAQAWRSLERAMAAPASAVVQVGPGYFLNPSSVRITPLTLVAEHPAVADGGTAINEGQRSIIEPAAVSVPEGAGEGPFPSVWRPAQLIGPRTGAVYEVWKWAASPVKEARQLGVASSRSAQPTRVAQWKKDKADLASPAGWAELLYTNASYRYGFYADGEDIYLRLPTDANPNQFYVTASAGPTPGLSLNGPDIRISGFEIRQFAFGISVGTTSGSLRATRNVVDHNLISGTLAGVFFRGIPGPPSSYGDDHVVEHNAILDTSLWSASPEHDAWVIPWMFIKGFVIQGDGTRYVTNRLGEQSESSAISGRGGARRVVVRHNQIDGPFNGVSPGYNPGYDRYAGAEMDVHDNQLRHIADDAFEPDGQAINFRAWRNRIEDTSVILSTGPSRYGPLYVFRNEAWRIGNHGVASDGAGQPGASALFFKYSGKSSPVARVYVLHNTFWTDPSLTPSQVHGGARFVGGGGTEYEAFYLRNNILRATGYAFHMYGPTPGRWDEDYNNFSTSDRARGLRYDDPANHSYTVDVAAYRAASGQGAHTNVGGDFVTAPRLSAPEVGDLSLPENSPLIDQGVPIPNISDRQGVDYGGTAPDLGAWER